MTAGIELSIRDYRELLAEQMPTGIETDDLDLLNYFSLSGFTYIDKEESIIVDGTEYLRSEWTLGDFKIDLGIAGTGDYDDCIIDIIEKIDSDDEVWIYTNPNIIQLDQMSCMQKKVDDRRNQLISEMNPRLATIDGLLFFWEVIFQSTRLIINEVPETDAEYMARAISELFGQSSAIIVLRRNFDRYGLTNYTLENSREDSFKWNSRAEAMSVNLHLDPVDYDRIQTLRDLFGNISLAGIRLFVLCPAIGPDIFGLNYGNGTDADDYIIPPPFIPGFGIVGEGFGTVFGSFYGNEGPSGNDTSDYVVPPPFIPGFGILGAGFGSLYGAIYGN